MKSGTIKTFVIVLLIITALYQTLELWFRGNPGRNFFYTIFAGSGTGETEVGSPYLSTPAKIILNHGNKKFSVSYPSSKTEELELVLQEAVRLLIQSSEFIAAEIIDWERLLTFRSVIYHYNISMPAGEFASSAGVRASSVTNRIGEFDMIIFVPQRGVSDYMQAYFVNTGENRVYLYQTNKSKINEKVYSGMDKLQNQISKDYIYISTKQQSGFDLFEGNLFLPQWTEKQLVSGVLKITSSISGETMQTIRRYVDGFFDIPAAVWEDYDMGVYRFSDPNIAVNIDENGVIEYTDYSPSKVGEKQSMYVAYTTAQNFFRKDATLTSALTLTDARPTEYGWTFFFNYNINDFYAFLGVDEGQRIGMESMVEVTVQDGKVKKYKRYAIDIDIDNIKTDVVELDFLSALDQIMKNIETPDDGKAVVNDMFLGYLLSQSSDGSLVWRTQVNGSWYAGQTKISE